MMQRLLSILRDRTTGTAEFRKASDALARLVCADVVEGLGVGDGAAGGDVMLVAVLRGGVGAAAGVYGGRCRMRRWLLSGLRGMRIRRSRICITRGFRRVMPTKALIIDPMLATAGTACLVAELLMREGYSADDMHFVGVLGSREGVERLAGVIPRGNISVGCG